MKKQILGICIVVLTLVALVSGCTENKTTDSTDDDNNGGTTGSSYTMTAKELNADMTMDTDWATYIKILYGTLGNGDTLIIQDTISEVSYDSEMDRATVTFEWTEDEVTSSLNLPFEGDISGSYQAGDEVKVTVTIKHVEFTYEASGASMDYEIEIFDEQWTTQEEYIASQGGALPATSIEKVE